MKTQITFLGTGMAIPTKSRNHVGILLSHGPENLLFDCGEGIQRQFRIADINPCNLTRLLITHWHGDHILGIPGLFQTLAMNNYNKVLQIYGPQGTRQNIFDLLQLFAISRDLKIQVNEIKEGIVFEEKEIKVEATPMSHTVPCLAYSFIEKEKLRLDKSKLKKFKLPNSPLLAKLQQGEDIEHLGKKIKSCDVTYLQKGKKISIILDTAFNKEAVQSAKGSDLLICESAYASTEDAKTTEFKHMTSSQAAAIAKESKSKKLILIHISQRYEGKEKILLKEAKKIFKSTTIANDFDKVAV